MTWQQHGGSGVSVSWQDALALDPLDRDWLLDRIGTQRSREARKLETAAKKK